MLKTYPAPPKKRKATFKFLKHGLIVKIAYHGIEAYLDVIKVIAYNIKYEGSKNFVTFPTKNFDSAAQNIMAQDIKNLSCRVKFLVGNV